ncbi:GNAT family N-acetyltransferase [Brevundimonas sp.]|uniref:GNAT family N-acetyltransferase n=1 Tax=Brevundimonas sp. TaxID=1871086 RepID=UPI0035641353
MTGPILETERLTLRPTAMEDFPRWAELMADPATARFIGGVQAAPATWRAMMSMAGAWSLTGVAMFSVIERETGLWLGRIGPWQPLSWPGTEVGWSLHPDAHGKGYAMEAAVASIDYAFDVLGWTEVIHCIDPDNAPSQKLADRLGSTNRGPGTLPAPFETARVDIWGQSRDQWRARAR